MTVYADGAKATIQVASGVNTSQTGLTPGAKYYVQGDGTLATTPDTPSVLAGIAISATKFLVSSSLVTAHPAPELPVAGVAGKVLKSDGTNWVSGDEAELPTPGIAGYVLKSDGSNWVSDAESDPGLPVAGTAGKLLTSDGTNWASVANPSQPSSAALTTIAALTPGTSGRLLTSDGTNWTSADAPTELPVAGTAGKILTSDGTNWISAIAAESGGTFDAAASGALADGDKVILRTDGKVAKVGPGAAVPADTVTDDGQTGDLGSQSLFHVSAFSMDPFDNTKFLYVYQSGPGGGANAATASVGTRAATSPNAITLGTGVTFPFHIGAGPTNSVQYVQPLVKFHPTIQGLFGIVSANSTGPCINFGTVSGSTITPVDSGAVLKVDGNFLYGNAIDFDWDEQYTGSGNRFVCTYAFIDGMSMTVDSYSRAGTVDNSGGSYSVGTEISSYGQEMHSTYHGAFPTKFDPNTEGKFIITYLSAPTNQPACKIGTLDSSHNITWGSPTLIGASTGGFSNIMYLEWNPAVANQFVFGWMQGTSFGMPMLSIGTVSGTSVTMATSYNTHTNSESFHFPVFSPDGTRIYVYGRTSTMSGDTIAGLALSLSGTTISAISGEAWPGEEILTGYANEGQYAMSQASKDGDWTIVDAVISGSGNNKLATGTIAAAGLPNLTAINFIGISDGIYADAATATIQIAGRIDDAQSGLTTGSTYYVQGDGTLSTVAATPSVLAGIAISATKLLIAEGVNVPSLPAVGSSGNLLTSDGTNWSSATAPLELPAAGTAGKLLTSDGTNWVSATAPLELPSAGTTGRLLTSDGTNWISSAHALPDVAGTFEAVASGALADGDKVILRSDGKVEHAVPQGAVAVATDEQGTVLQGVNGDIRNDRWGTTIDFDPLDNNKFVVGYWDSSGATGARLQMVVGTLSGTTISWGTPVDIIAAAPQGGSMISFKFHPTEANLIGVVFGTDGSVATGTSGFGGHFGVATVSGTSLTYTDLLGFDNLQNLGETNVTPHYRYATFSFDWDSQFTGVGFRCAWQHEWQLPYPSGEKFHTASAAIMEILPGLGPVLNASTVSVRLDTRTYTGGVVRIRSCRFDPFTEGKFFATWIRHSYDEPRMHIMQLATNATTFAIGSEVDMGFGQGSYPSNSNITEDDHYCEWNPLTQNQFLFSGRRKHEYGNPNNNSVPELVVGTVSGTSVTFGTNFIYTGDGYGSDSPFQIHWDPTNANRFYAVWSPATNASYYSESIYAQRYILAGTAPNITMTAEGTPTDMTPGPENGHSWTNSFTYLRFNSAMNASGTKLMLNHIFNGDAASTGGYVAASGKTAFTSGGTSVPGVPNLTTANFIGISDGVYADAATATIQTAGVIDDAQSGLTSGSLYYLHDDGTLSTTPDTISVLAGTAISATKLLIAEGINVPVLPTAGIAGKVLKSDGTNWISGDEEEFFTPTFQAEASGSLADGDKVVLLSDGKVKLTSNASTLMAPPSSDSQAQTLGVRVPSPNHPVTAQATSSPATSATPSSDTPSQKAWISYDPFDENKFLVAYDDIANGSRPSCRVGIISGTTISFGTAITLHNHTIVEDHSPLAIHFHPTRQNFFACAYAGNGQNMYGDVRAYFGWVAGNSVSFINKFEGFQTGTWRGRRSGTVCFTWDHFSSTNHFVMSWDGLTVASTGPNAGKYAHTESMLVCGTIGATGTPYNMQYPHPGSASFPPRIDVNDDKWWYGLGQVRSCRFDPNTANKFLVTGFKNSSGTSTTPVLYICTTNGALSITTGSEIDLFADIGITGIGEHHCEWNPGIPNQIVFSGQQAFSGTSNHLDPVFCVGTVVGTSVTWGSIFRVVPGASHSGTTSQPWEIFFGASNATGRFYGATSLHPSGGLVGNIDMQAFQITGTTIAAVGATAAIAPHQWFDSFNNASHIGVAFPWHVAVSASGNKFMISHLTGTGSGNHTKFTSGTIFQAGVRNLTSTNFIGISDGVYADGATATIQVAGAIDDAQSGLTPGSIYYLAANGTLSTTPDTDSVLAGTAISATKLLISEGTKQQSNRALGTLLSTHQGLFL